MANTNYSPTFPMFPGDAFAITPSDVAPLANVAVLYIGNSGPSGSVRVTTAQGNIVSFSGLVAGTVLPLQVRQVWSTGTDVTGLLGIF
jgi:hypothetical protein